MGGLRDIAAGASLMALHDVEDRLRSYQRRDSKDDTILVLRTFLDNLPIDGKENLLEDIRACKTDDELEQCASSLVERLLFPLRIPRKTRPNIGPRFGLQGPDKNITSELTESAVQSVKSGLWQACLSRDGNMCVLTHYFEDTSVEARQPDVSTTYAACAYIIPVSLGTRKSDIEQLAVSQIWVSLYRYFPSLRRINFNQHSINDTRNAITMGDILYRLFCRFDIALEATDKAHTYRIQNHVPNGVFSRCLPASDLVSFVNHDNRHELPSPTLLEVHATIARILHTTGKAEQADKLQRERDDIEILAKDGSTDLAALFSTTSLALLCSRSRSQEPHF